MSTPNERLPVPSTSEPIAADLFVRLVQAEADECATLALTMAAGTPVR